MLLAIFLLSAAGFTVLTTEFIIVGLLPSVARDLHVSIPQAGLLVTLFAFTVAAFGPFLTAWFARFERRRLFISVLLMFGLANTLAAVAPDIWVMALARLIPALGLPVFWALASETAVDIVGPQHAGRAIARIGFGIVCATVFGIPVGTLVSDAFGWRSAFAILAVIAFAKALLLFIYLPKTNLHLHQVSFRSQFKILRSPLMQGHVLLSILVFSGMFTAYTYLADILERLAGFDGTLVGWCLMGFGAVGLVGNSLGGRAVDRHPLIASMVFCLFMIGGMVALVPSIHSSLWLAAAMAIWGVTQAALFLVSHVRLMKAAPEAPAFAASLNIAGANLGIGLGAMVGGRVIDTLGLGSVGFAAAGFILLSILLALLLMTFKPRHASSGTTRDVHLRQSRRCPGG
ncbi:MULTISPECIES: MFS transporter [unclassified Pseudomonas]|uniref:MFS transporter n=1 Tax=unclassified Pseudomonas TaxID=196821 RepID=UPI001199414C|nr:MULTISPECIES: MFS transporter [unclassified Pseudomonas]TWC15660.1 putative MFS family arabinose efflux permease [Pseudomonas sp. SJZ074]TWC21159.1 putative MFS family arabinose efflux permease [Pseudomonas sp. SJZ075]TWC33936.1 putative MFS family arabinose efflux permease [Pseudomonas sp. SJZ085]TWC36639.1 putative MFS family arabinose efflux permease [Pseudomonas sp. SJZ078]TWC57398.1 putative MFS family arabinose efflux permease [Pseudomonas sp. SJZ124]